MFKSIKRLLIAATGILAMSAPCAAGAFIRDTGGGPATSGQAPLSIVRSIPRASSSEGFQWGDAGAGAAGVIVLLGAGAGAASVMRSKREHRPIAG
ncbi:MAG: hypothetical protein WAL38_21240 [Solirubrobacteraceae bacterium]